MLVKIHNESDHGGMLGMNAAYKSVNCSDAEQEASERRGSGASVSGRTADRRRGRSRSEREAAEHANAFHFTYAGEVR